jgi:protein-disulfide isomerase
MQLAPPSRSSLALAVLGLVLLPLPQLLGQTATPPAAPTPQPSAQAAPGAPNEVPQAPKPVPPPPAFPLVDRANFTAASPSVDAVNGFLKAFWGYDPNRLWQVQAILKTPVQGLSRVVVLIEEKGAAQQQPQSLGFFVLPDGTHLIAGEEVMPFGTDPFAANRKLLQASADGPSKGAPAKALELVEFSDFQCPHCKDAQQIVERLLKDFPSAHFVYQNFPLTAVHSEAEKAAEYGVCVAKQGGNDAFYKFADDIFTNQAKLTPEGSTDALKAAVTTAGQDPAKIAACVAMPETKTAVDASAQLGKDIGVNQTPFLFINGRGLPLGGVPYDTLKQMVAYQAQLDGVPMQ